MDEFCDLVAKIETELDRLDAQNDGQEILCAAHVDLPEGWVRVYDETGDAYGPAEEILAALEAVEYDAQEIVWTENRGGTCYDRDCQEWHGEEPSAGSPHAHGHHEYKEVTAAADNLGFDLAWAALGEFSDSAPQSAK